MRVKQPTTKIQNLLNSLHKIVGNLLNYFGAKPTISLDLEAGQNDGFGANQYVT